MTTIFFSVQEWLGRHLTYAKVGSTACPFILLGGTSYAARPGGAPIVFPVLSSRFAGSWEGTLGRGGSAKAADEDLLVAKAADASAHELLSEEIGGTHLPSAKLETCWDPLLNSDCG